MATESHESLDEVLRTQFGGRRTHVIARRGSEACLRREDLAEHGVLVAWLSRLTVLEFAQAFRLDDPTAVVTIGPDRPTPRPLTPSDLEGSLADEVYLVRIETQDAWIVWERAGSGWSDVAAVAADAATAAESLRPALPTSDAEDLVRIATAA